jgi:hypothetical protein
MATLDKYGPVGPMAEPATLTIPRYLTTDGRPTCCTDVPSGMVCPLLRTRNYGAIMVCQWAEKDLDPYRAADGGYDPTEWIAPASDCPLWPASEGADD